jgi:hypothetical protein
MTRATNQWRDGMSRGRAPGRIGDLGAGSALTIHNIRYRTFDLTSRADRDPAQNPSVRSPNPPLLRYAPGYG